MPRAKKTKGKGSSTESSSSGAFVPNPPVSEQKLLRRKDSSIVPGFQYLVASKALDAICDDIPILKNACPDAADGGWRSKLPDPEWGTFPHGKLSHSFSMYWSEDEVLDNLTFGDYLRSLEAPAIRTKGGAPKNDGNNNHGGGNGGLAATLGNYYNFAFHTNNTTLGDLTCPSSLLTLFVLVLLLRLFKRVFLPRFTDLGRRLGRSAHGPDWEDENAERIIKFGEYVYRLVYHTSVSAYGVWYFRDKAWWVGAGRVWTMWEDWTFQVSGPGMAWYYLVQSAYNVDALVSLVELSFTFEWVNPLAYSSALDFLEKEHVMDDRQRKREVFKMMAKSKRKRVLWTPLFEIKWSSTVRGDFKEMLVHHFVTNFLIFGSSSFRLTRVGSMVFFLHDLSDIPVDLSKLANFVKWKMTTTVCFFTMCIVWVMTRLYVFPFHVCKSAALDTYEHLVVRGVGDPAAYWAGYPFFVGGLVALVFLHATWFLILLRIGWTLTTKGEAHDFSEHRNGEEGKKDR